jgi:hypothetical protein
METNMPDNTDEPIRKVSDLLETLKAETAEAIEMMRPHFPNRSEDSLRQLAEALRSERYRSGRWPDFAEIARNESGALAAAPTPLILAVIGSPSAVPSAESENAQAVTCTEHQALLD